MSHENPALDGFPVPRCATCGAPTRLFGIEWETESHDILTFVCDTCGAFTVRPVPTKTN